MTSTLHDRLARLADEAAPAADATSGRELWERGVRYRRRLRAGTAAVLAVAAAVLVALAGVSLRHAAPPPRPVPAEAPAGLPSRIHEPSPWLPGTAEDGPLGQVVTLLPADRGGWFGSDPGVVGISATTGEYRFLDLPDQADQGTAALAPDGRHVAYWMTGPTTDTPNTSGGQVERVAAGVAIYDTTTGEVDRHLVDTSHGLSDDLLVWVDADSLIVDFTQWVGGDDDSDMDRSSATYAPALWWDLGSEPRLAPEFDRISPSFGGVSTSGRVALIDGEGDFAVIDGDGSYRRWTVGASMNQQGGPAIDPSGTRVAGVSTRGAGIPTRVATAVLPETRDGSTSFREVPRSDRSYVVLGWRDSEHVLVTTRVENWRDCTCLGFYEMDVRTGESEPAIELPEDFWVWGQWATDLLDAPIVTRPAPPTPVDPRWVAGPAVTTLLGAALLIWRWRRRVQP